MNIKKYQGEVIIFIVALMASWGWFFSKFAMTELPPVGFVGLRFSLACLLFIPLAFRQLRTLTGTQFYQSSLVGLAFTANMLLWVMGLSYSRYLGEGAFIISLAMLIVPLLNWMIFKIRPIKIFWICLPVAILGLYFLSSGKGKFHFSLGNMIFLCSTITAAIYFILNNRFAQNVPPLALTTIQVGIVGICCTFYSVIFETWQFPISSHIWGWFALSVLIATNGRVLLQTIGQKYCNVSTGAFIMLLEPVWAMWLSILIFDEEVSPIKGLGCVLILGALIIYRLPAIWKKRKKA
ncbi:DMT family transporter [Caviibacterium pharyngocola]|uniref:EamA family transporter n=1 Tax=Caviibacterium pharyngocola TaxID=28159 RepID=A0A2M8RZ32_9PAST|nr:DMT family transporter [Caviibacterium pharyngocola]PJG84149.1 EamA family transporter [Caviibacterium pharyngocola]